MRIEEHLAKAEALIRKYARASFVLSTTLTPDRRPGGQLYLVGLVAFIDGSRLHFREFVKETRGTAVKVMYTYHYQDADGRLIFRYDNARHHPALGFDEHKHTPDGVVAAPSPTLEDVLAEIVVTQMWA
jgi:hypothetical protein